MDKSTLHIVNGDSLASQMIELNLEGKVIVWRELLCEGPTRKTIDEKFFQERIEFLSDTYQITKEEYEERFVSEIKNLKDYTNYDKVVLWFEFDLFCHMNMLAAINFIGENKENVPVSLVCSRKLKGEKELKPLSQLNLKELSNHFDNRIQLTEDDLEIARHIWELYCCDNPLKLKPLIKTKSNFEYLSSCIRAHVERFPNSETGINSLEKNILKLIQNQTICNMNHLLGYSLEYQGYYGYSDHQMQRLLAKLDMFYVVEPDKISLSESGKEVLIGKKNFYRTLKSEEYFGGSKMYDYLYESETHRLLKL